MFIYIPNALERGSIFSNDGSVIFKKWGSISSSTMELWKLVRENQTEVGVLLKVRSRMRAFVRRRILEHSQHYSHHLHPDHNSAALLDSGITLAPTFFLPILYSTPKFTSPVSQNQSRFFAVCQGLKVNKADGLSQDIV